jgi:hypothetical protein
VAIGEGEADEPFLWRFRCLVVGAVDATGIGEAPAIADADFECLRFFLPIGDALAIGIFMPLAIGIAIALDIGFGMAVAAAPMAPLIAPAAFDFALLVDDFAVLVPDAPFWPDTWYPAPSASERQAYAPCFVLP